MSTSPHEPGTPHNDDEPSAPPVYPPVGDNVAPPGNAYPAHPQYGQDSFGQAYQPYPGEPSFGGTPVRSGAQTYSIIGFVCAAIAVLFCPLIGIVGVVLGVIGKNRGEPLGKWAAIASAVCLVIGFGISLALYNSGVMHTS